MHRHGFLLISIASSAMLGVLAPMASSQGASVEFFGPSSSKAIDISPDGLTVVGIEEPNGPTGYRWSSTTGYDSLPNSEAWGVSAGGSVITGSARNGSGLLEGGLYEAGAWTLTGNFGAPGCDSSLSHLYGVSDDGQTASGMAWQGCAVVATKWTASGGLTALAQQSPSNWSKANAVSGDGQVFGGWETANSGQRRACVWWADGTQEFLAVSPSNPTGIGEVSRVNADGSVLCGVSESSALLWTSSGGLQILPPAPGLGGEFIANGVSDDGGLVAGVSLAFPVFNAWIWTPQTGSVSLYDHLLSLGVTGITPQQFGNATSVSADGTRICGWGIAGSWVVTLDPPADPWTDLGNGLAGVQGVPALAGDGPLTGGSATTISLTDGVPGGSSYLVVGVSSFDAPFKGGVLVPNPDIVLAGLPLDAQGDLAISFHWPAGLPSGASTWWQHWMQDGAGVLGWSASNGLQATTP